MKKDKIKKLEKTAGIESSDLVVQHNDLIQANYTLTLQEKRIILWLSSQVRKDDEEFKNHELIIKDFCEIADIKSKNMYHEIGRITKELIQKVLEVRRENSLMFVSWLSYAEYFHDEGRVILRFDPALQPYLLNIKEQFTLLSLEQTLSFKSFYSIRLYEHLKQFVNLGIKRFQIEEIRKNLGVKSGRHASYANVKRHVINGAVEEINEKSDIQVRFEEVKKGRKVVALNFYIDQKKEESEECKIIKRAMSLNISKKEMQHLLSEFSLERLDTSLQVLETYIGKINNPLLFFRKSLEECWQPFVGEKVLESVGSNSSVEAYIEALSESEDCKVVRKTFIRHEGEKDYKSWLSNTSMEIMGTVLKVKVKSPFVAQYIQTNYVHVLKEAAPNVEYVEVVVQADQEMSLVKKEEQRIVNNKNISSVVPVKKTITAQNNGKKLKKKTVQKELPNLLQLSLWDRIKTSFKKP